MKRGFCAKRPLTDYKMLVQVTKLQNYQLLPYWQFYTLIIGSQIPNSICLRIYEMFASQSVNQTVHEMIEADQPLTQLTCGMNYDDLQTFYSAFKNSAEIDQVAFWLIQTKVSREVYIEMYKDKQLDNQREITITLKDLVNFGKRTCCINPKECESMLVTIDKLGIFRSGNDVTLQVFKTNFMLLKDMPCFQWLFTLMHAYKSNYSNYDTLATQSPDDRRLSIASVEKQKQLIEQDTQLTEEEISLIEQFYTREIKARNAKYLHAVYSKMFSKIKNETLKSKYFINVALSRQGNSTLEYLCNLVQVVCKDMDDDEFKIKFLFDCFSDFQDFIKRSQLKDFTDIFKIPITDFPEHNLINYDDFLAVVDEYEIPYILFQVCKPMLTAMFCLTPADDQQEKEAILAAVNDNPNIESYILEYFTSEIEQFYVCEKQFWDEWQSSIGFQYEQDNFGLKVQHKTQIENVTILEKHHKFRLKDHCQYLSDFVILPKYVFLPLSKWYTCDIEITREVISYKSQLHLSQRGQNLLVQRQDSMRSSYSKNFKQSGVKFNNKREVVDDDYICFKGDISYELEIQPKVVYLAPVDPLTGELLFQKIVNQTKIDFQALKKAMKDDQLPFQELLLSRKTTFEYVLGVAAKQLKMNPKKGRLIVDGNVLMGTKLLQSFEDLKINTGTLIHFEFINDQNEWPSDKVQTKKAESSQQVNAGKSQVKQTSGLINLGNSCYMNSALQVLANISQLYEYFVVHKQYLTQLNVKSQPGHSGMLAITFGTLLNEMWNSNTAIAPIQLKKVLALSNDQFASYDQQDSQEYLSYMIDSLHEELNLRLKKPYIINPESLGRQPRSLAHENWSNALRREWSIIFFLFYGQMRSNLKCQQCQIDSSTFDIFSNIPVPLPEPTQQTISIIVHRLPNKVKDLLYHKIKQNQDGTFSYPSFGQDEEINFRSRPASSARNTTLIRQKTTLQQQAAQSQFNEQYNYLSNDQPFRIHIKVVADIQVLQLLQKITAIRETNLDPTFYRTEPVLFSLGAKTKRVRKIYEPDYKLSEIDFIQGEFYCQEVLTQKGRDCIKKFYQQHPTFAEQHPESRLRILMFPTNFNEFEKKKQVDQSFKTIESDYQPQIVTVIFYHRRFVKKESPIYNTVMPQLLSVPFIIKLPTVSSGRRLYDEAWAMASNLVRPNSKVQKPGHQWWQRKDWQKNINNLTNYRPFILKQVNDNGLNCSKCHWMLGCAGCIIEPSDIPIQDFGSMRIVVEWQSEVLMEYYNYSSSEVIEHSSVKVEVNDSTTINYTSLDDCLTKFHKPEILENQMKCGKCNDLTNHMIRQEIFRPPAVLIIQLKRFRQVGSIWRKVQTSVDFPIRNLDIRAFVADQEFLNQSGIETKYNLHGVVNHFGTLNYGHYTTYVINHKDKKWYQYDDNICTQINESQLSKEAAYILFYVRVDIQDQPLAQIYPKIESAIFPGKPIQTKDGKHGYVINVNAEQVEIQLVSDKQRQTQQLKQVLKVIIQYRLNELAKETDTSVITLSVDENMQLSNLKQKVFGEQEQVTQNKEQDFDNSFITKCCSVFLPDQKQPKQPKQQKKRQHNSTPNIRKLQVVDRSVKITSEQLMQQSEIKPTQQFNDQDESLVISQVQSSVDLDKEDNSLKETTIAFRGFDAVKQKSKNEQNITLDNSIKNNRSSSLKGNINSLI